jgi:uncharacterized protein YecE (DUF72 family)
MFMDRAGSLADSLGPILVQLPPRWDVNLDRLAGFLHAVPHAHRWAVEFRDPRWLCDAVFAVLRQYQVALCIHDLIQDHPQRVTADWVYLRFHGVNNSGKYSPSTLRVQAQQIKQYLVQGKDVFAYFNNDAHGYAVQNAIALKHLVATRSSSHM